MSLVGPPPVSSNPFARLAADIKAERGAAVPFPPGDTRPSMIRTQRFANYPLALLLDAYERHGPVFSLRIFHGLVVFMLGPGANHYMTVSHASNFSWREGHMGDLMPLLGDGLLTIDGDFHRRSRMIMLPAFHRERIEAARATMVEEVGAALDAVEPGDVLDLYHWTRELAMRIAMRALFGIDPDGATARDVQAAEQFERALGFYARDYVLQLLRGPRTPYAQMLDARRRLNRLIFGEIERRRRTGERGMDILSLLLDAEDEEGNRLSDRHIRDEVMTLLFAGHDTTTSTVTFLFHELSRHPEWADRAAASAVDLELCIDETLRMYPPAWIGPRRSIEPFELEGVPVPGGVPVNYCSWASHHLPDVWAAPKEFRPERFAEEQRAKLPKGAYVPFGGGSRTCIGMRFGQQEVRVIASGILERFRLQVDPAFKLRIRQMPTIGPRGGLTVTVRAAGRGPARTSRPAVAA